MIEELENIRAILEGRAQSPEGKESEELMQFSRDESEAMVAFKDEMKELLRLVDEGGDPDEINRRHHLLMTFFQSHNASMEKKRAEHQQRVDIRAKQAAKSEKKVPIYQRFCDEICRRDPDAHGWSLRELAKRIHDEMTSLQRLGKTSIKEIDSVESIRKKIKHPLK